MADCALLEKPSMVSTVHMDLQAGDKVVFSEAGIEIALVAKSGRHARLCVVSPRNMRIERKPDPRVPFQACQDS